MSTLSALAELINYCCILQTVTTKTDFLIYLMIPNKFLIQQDYMLIDENQNKQVKGKCMKKIFFCFTN